MKFWMILLLAVCLSAVYADFPQQAQQEIKEQVCAILTQVDNQQRGGRLQDREFVISIYQQILQRNPSERELQVATLFLQGDKCCDDEEHQHDQPHFIRITRSHLLARLLAKKENVSVLTYDILQRQLPLLRGLDLDTVPFFKPHVFVEKKAQKVNDLSLKAHTGEYQVFHGYLHSHTSYSDGEGTPEEAYTMVRDIAQMDFFAVTDHAISLHIFPWDNKWQKIKDTADRFNKDHEFAALYGFEWSSPVFGHINVFNTEDFIDCVQAPLVSDICNWVGFHPGALSRFNHPGRDPLGMEFDHFALHPVAIRQMVGIEMFSKGKGIKNFIDKGYFGKYNYLDEANQLGWKLGSMGGQDNHDNDWGIRNNFNVGVWATELTRAAILEAYQERRTYACEDLNLTLSFKIDDAQMGSRLVAGPKELVVDLADGDRENFTRVDIYQSGIIIKTYEVKSSAPQIRHPITTKAGDYFYVLATQEDGNLALSSPIWIVE